jgi:hypothetical protein
MQIFHSGASEHKRVIFKKAAMFDDTGFTQEKKIKLKFYVN